MTKFRTVLCLLTCGLCVCATATEDDLEYLDGLLSNGPSQAFETIPYKVSPTGEHLSDNLTSYHDDGRVHFNLTINNRGHILSLSPSKRFLGPAIIIERRGSRGRAVYKPSNKSTACHFEGYVKNQPKSRVALSACNGLTGLLHTEDGRFYIEPARGNDKIVKPGHKHVVYKRSTGFNALHHRRKRKRKRRKVKNCGTKEPAKLTQIKWAPQLGKLKVQEKEHRPRENVKIANVKKSQRKNHLYRRVGKRKKRSVSSPHYVEVLLVADTSMVEFHEDGDLETYLLTIMNMVSTLFKDPSIGNYVKIIVVKIILIDDPQAEPDLEITSNADFILRSFCKWQRNQNLENDTHPHHHDVAVLLTRKSICRKSAAYCNTLGVAHVGGMCKTERSCNVNRDNGITSAYTIAHEMGHNLGMVHDTEKIGCSGRQGDVQHIMTPSFQADTMGVSWSRCSRRDITNFLDKGLAGCLDDQPQELDAYDYPELPPGAMYDANYQCRLQFGEEATVCSPKDEICSRLWCTVNDTCTTLLLPAAPGTNCGKHKWCQNLKCVPIMEPPVPIDGGWGEWSSWSSCSRSCGAGISVSQRYCDHPKPAAGGSFCVGTRKKYRICNTDPCPSDTPTFRAYQCSQYNNETYEGKTYEWLPYFDQDDPCKLYCTDINDTVIAAWGEYARDGTPCNVGTRDVCISGICKQVGCDWVVNSSAKEDECGICQGDATKCHIVKGVYEKQSQLPGYREMVVIPPGARNIRIEEKRPSENYISIGSATKNKFFLNGKRQITLPGEYVIAGSQALYDRRSREKVIIPGPINESIVVLLIFRGKTYNPGVEYKYSFWKPETTKQLKYSWTLSDWSQCSVTCGGGVQFRKPLCRESVVSSMQYVLYGASRIVDEINCEPQDQPERVKRVCNEDPCPTHWWVGPWQSCPVTCHKEEERPMRRRSVMCVDGQEMALPDHFCDRNMKPLEYEACRSLPECLLNANANRK